MDTDAHKNNPDKTDTDHRAAIWVITPNGLPVASLLEKELKDVQSFVSEKLVSNDSRPKKAVPFSSLSNALKTNFKKFSSHIFIFSTGIAVRMIAPLLESKLTDPAVVVLDDRAIHCISLVSGHIGGANALAKKVGKLTGANPVITTATDTNNLPAIDMLAKENNCVIENPSAIKKINMAFLMGNKLILEDPMGIIEQKLSRRFWNKKKSIHAPDVFCSHIIKNISDNTLVLRPKVLSIGIGCNRNTMASEIQDFLFTTLKKQLLSQNAIFTLATIDVKKDEKGLLALSEQLELPLKFYDKNALNSVKNIETPSMMAKKHLGVKSVCEAAAILSADNGTLILPKQKQGNVTLAVAIKDVNSTL
ncbi:MAG: cobalt-precorrin 5A hydrolase [Desulfobacteraceae bacterium]|nr:cobalt-precorrin 5A hydrolase [Desulfobacteraceae bacterium]